MFHSLFVVEAGADYLSGVQNHLFWVRAPVMGTIMTIMEMYLRIRLSICIYCRDAHLSYNYKIYHCSYRIYHAIIRFTM